MKYYSGIIMIFILIYKTILIKHSKGEEYYYAYYRERQAYNEGLG